MKPRGTLTVVGAENEKEPMSEVVYAWVIVEDETGKRFRFAASVFHFDLEPIPET